MRLPSIAAWKEHLKFKYGPRVAHWLLHVATKKVRRRLDRAGMSVLLDNTIFYHGITHESVWVSTGTKLWGGVHPIDTGYVARVPVHAHDDPSIDYQNIKYLPTIAHLARSGHIKLLTSAELKNEAFRQPAGRYDGYGYFDSSVFEGVPIESVDGWTFPDIGPSWMNLPSAAEQQRTRLSSCDDPLYRALVEVMGQKNSQDAWHTNR